MSAVLLSLASVASAASFTVTLENGTSFESRYRPVSADWDDTVALIRTDVGNWIAVPKAEIVDVVSQAEVSGFGYQLDTTTLFVGWSPNDLADDDEEGEDADGSRSEDDFYDYEAQDDGDDYGLDQFVDIPQAGESIGGIDLLPERGVERSDN